MKKRKINPDSVKCMQVNATTIAFPKLTLMEKLGLKDKAKNLNDIELLYDDDDNIMGLQFNFVQMIKTKEIMKEEYIK